MAQKTRWFIRNYGLCISERFQKKCLSPKVGCWSEWRSVLNSRLTTLSNNQPFGTIMDINLKVLSEMPYLPAYLVSWLSVLMNEDKNPNFEQVSNFHF